MKRDIDLQNKSLKMAAQKGYIVAQQPKETLGRDGKPLLTEAQQEGLGLNPNANPDALINKRVFDVYCPNSKYVENVHAGVAKKVNSNQAHRILVNLSETEVTPSDLRQYLKNNPIANLKEIILIDQSGKIKNFFPF